MNPILMEAFAEFVLFFDLSDDEVVDPDAATQQLEQAGSYLAQLAPGDRVAFAQYVNSMILAEQNGRNRTERVRGLLSLVENLTQDFEAGGRENEQ